MVNKDQQRHRRLARDLTPPADLAALHFRPFCPCLNLPRKHDLTALSYWLTAKLFPLNTVYILNRMIHIFYLHQGEAPARARPKAEALLASPKGRYCAFAMSELPHRHHAIIVARWVARLIMRQQRNRPLIIFWPPGSALRRNRSYLTSISSYARSSANQYSAWNSDVDKRKRQQNLDVR